jgi:hypothetical protein
MGALSAGCTQDFGQFESLGLGSGGASNTTASTSATTSTDSGGSGGATTTSSGSGGTTTTTTGSGGAGGTGGAGGNGGTGGTVTTTGSGGSGGATTTTTGSGGSGGSGGSTTTIVGEDCTNGVDDDDDGLADCADTKCQPVVACVPKVPFNWTGPVILYDGAPASLPTECPTSYPILSYEGQSGVKDQPAECSACTCGDPKFNCNLANIVGYWNDTCSGGNSSQSQSTGCQQGLQNGLDSAKINPPTVSTNGQNNGSCAPSQVQPTKPAPEWSKAGFACGGASMIGDGCTSAQVCAPKPAAGFNNVMCIQRDGDRTCPAEFPDKHTYVNQANDTRGCSACACGAGKDLACSAVTTLHDTGAQCNNTPNTTIPNDGSCVAIKDGSRKTTVTQTGSCTPSGGEPTGTIVDDLAGAVTVWCVTL